MEYTQSDRDKVRKRKGRGTGDGREAKDSAKRVHGCMGKTTRTHAHTHRWWMVH